MMFLASLLVVGIVTAVFVGVNVGGSSAGVAFGPATGSDILSMRLAAALMAVSALAGGLLIGPNVVETLGMSIVNPSFFTVPASIAILAFTGLGILVGNVLKVSSSTSEIAVGAIAGMGFALGALNVRLLGTIFVWWIVSSVVAFWISAAVGRYLYEKVVELLDFSGKGDRWAKVLVTSVGCYMAFSAGASNVGNAVAPLVGAGSISMIPAVLLAGAAMAVGAFLIGPRTMRTIGDKITQLTLEAALVVELVSATIITLLSQAGIPASLAIVSTLSVVGLGWGRATRRVPLKRELGLEEMEEKDRERKKKDDPKLYNLQTTKKATLTWTVTPLMAGFATIAFFKVAIILGLM